MLEPIVLIDNVCDPARPGESGHSDSVWELATELTAAGHPVEVVAPYAQARAPRPGVVVHKFPLPPGGLRNAPLQWFAALNAALVSRKHVRDGFVQVTDAFSAAAAGLVVKQPVVFVVSGSIHQRETSDNRLDIMATATYKLASRVAATRSAFVIASSRDMSFWWHYTGTPYERIRTIPLGVDVDRFKPHSKKQRPVGKPNAKRILSVARLSRENDLHILLRVMAELPSTLRKDVLVHIVGTGPLDQDLKQEAQRLGLEHSVIWHGAAPYSDLASLYAAADVMVVTRRSGAPPRVVCQALACGVPVVAFDAAGIADYVEHGRTGLLAPVGDALRLADELRGLLLDDERRERLGRAARLYAEAHLAWSVVVQRLETEVYVHLRAG